MADGKGEPKLLGEEEEVRRVRIAHALAGGKGQGGIDGVMKRHPGQAASRVWSAYRTVHSSLECVGSYCMRWESLVALVRLGNKQLQFIESRLRLVGKGENGRFDKV